MYAFLIRMVSAYIHGQRGNIQMYTQVRLYGVSYTQCVHNSPNATCPDMNIWCCDVLMCDLCPPLNLVCPLLRCVVSRVWQVCFLLSLLQHACLALTHATRSYVTSFRIMVITGSNTVCFRDILNKILQALRLQCLFVQSLTHFYKLHRPLLCQTKHGMT